MDTSVRAPRAGQIPPDGWFTPARFSLFLAVLIVVQYPQLSLGTQSLFFRDFGHFGYPNAFHVRECFWMGELPLWNPLSNCGIPFLAQWNTMVLYPGSLCFVVLPLPWSLNLFALLHLFLGGLGMYCLARKLTGNSLAASLAGTAFAFNGVTMNAVMWPSIISALGLAPWVIVGLIKAWRHGGRWIAPAVVLGTIQMLTGGVEVIVSTWLVAGVICLDDGFGSRTDRLRIFSRFVLVILVVSLLSSIQLLPFLELLANSERSETSAGSIAAMPFSGWANFLVPLFGTLKSSTGLPFQPGQFWLTSYYLGIGTVVLAFASLLLRPNRQTLLLGGACTLCLILALGDAGLLYGWLLKKLPMIGIMRFPVKFVLPVLLMAPLLAAMAVKAIICGPPERSFVLRRRFLLIAGCMVAAVATLAVFASAFQAAPELVLTTRLNALVRVAFLACIGILLLWIAARPLHRWSRWAGVALLLAGWLDVLTHAPEQAPTVASEFMRMPLASHRSMTEQPKLGLNRAMVSQDALAVFDRTQLADTSKSYLGIRLGLYFNCNLLEGIPKTDGFYPLVPKYHARLANRFHTSKPLPGAILDMVGVSQMTAPGNVTDWEPRPAWLQLVTGGQLPVWLDDPEALDRLFTPTFDPRHETLMPPESQSELDSILPGNPTVQLKHFSSHLILFSSQSEQPALVFLAQSYYPEWEARVDGRGTRLWRANVAFQAIAVPAGRHEVVLTYRDRRFWIGAGITFMTTLALLGAQFCGIGDKDQGRRPDTLRCD